MVYAQQSPRNHRDAFSHSEQCDSILSLGPGSARRFCDLAHVTLITDTAIIQGWTVDLFKHKNCRCWCHTALDRFIDPNADCALPEEYITSADRAFMLDEATRTGVELQIFGVAQDIGDPFFEETDYYDAEFDAAGARSVTRGPEAVRLSAPVSKAGFSDWSREELRSGKCSICGDKLADCECTE